MRKACIQQLPLVEAAPDHPKAKELARISEILDNNTSIYDLVLQDLVSPDDNEVGARGMTAEQVLRAAIIKQMEGYSYRELAFHLVDSRAYSRFCRIGFGRLFRKSTLQRCIKAISDGTWEQINIILITYADSAGIEKGRKARVDCTVVESNIHAPYDSDLLFDAVRVLGRAMKRLKIEVSGLSFTFADNYRRAKKRNLGIMNAKNGAERKKLYRDLIMVTEKNIRYGEQCLQAIKSFKASTLEEHALVGRTREQLVHSLPLARQVVCQARRRIFDDESVPALEKIVSIFEPHTDIIRKDRRDTYYGHKICLTGGASNLILDCVILKGNPADSTLTEIMLDRQNEIYGQYPLNVSFDGGFASKENLKRAKGKKGLKDICFSKGRGLAVEDMCRSSWVYKQLRNFRAGIESGISWLKRSLGLDRCTWKGFDSFKSYVWASIVSANLLTIARKQLA